MLVNLWTFLGNVGAGVWAALIWFISFIGLWAYLMSTNNWGDDNPHWLLFGALVTIAIVGAPIVGYFAFRAMKRGMNRVHAQELEARWITRRQRREMRQYSRQRR
jgi:hypothetical protein